MPKSADLRHYSTEWDRILQELCSIATAPFVENRVIAFVRQWAARLRRVEIADDRHGNLLLLLRGRSSDKKPRWIFTAHMDHPGFVARRMIDDATLEADFRGGVEASYFPGAAVRFFDGQREIRGVVSRYRLSEKRPVSATLRVHHPVSAGCAGMWDVGAGRFRGGKFLSRVCDDLAGAAAALAMLGHLAAHRVNSTVGVLLTRAEEVGFIGAMAASKQPRLLRNTDRLIAIECSSAQPHAPLGNGAIIRVGDRTSVFNSSLSYFITKTATELAKRDRKFKFQRALMPGGTCEATVYDVYGFTAASICVPLGNYHNMDKARGKIAPEFIDRGDWQSMVKLFIEVARNAHAYAPGHVELKKTLEKRYAALSPLLHEVAK